jgi:hypothetical protein
MDLTVREHVNRLQQRLLALNQQIMETRSRDDRNRIETEIRAVNLALEHYKAALELEKNL